MPNARARLAPTTSMISEPTTARMICVCTTAGCRSGVPLRRGRSASTVPSSAASGRRIGGRKQLLLERVHHARKIDTWLHHLVLHEVGVRRISPESTRLPRREMVWNRSTSPSISTSMKLCSVSKPLAVSAELPMMSPARSLAEPPAVK